jgi:hypothetical protein
VLACYGNKAGIVPNLDKLAAQATVFDRGRPVLVQLPGQCQSRRVTSLVSQVDLIPTLLDLLGQSLRPWLATSSGTGVSPVHSGSATGGTPVRLAGPGRDVFLRWTVASRFARSSRARLEVQPQRQRAARTLRSQPRPKQTPQSRRQH